MLLSIEGEEKTAKSTLALTAPLPIVLFGFDIGQDRAINGTQFDKYFKGLKIETIRYNRFGANDPTQVNWQGNDITIFELPQPIQLDSRKHEGYIALWDYFISLLGMAASDSNVASVIVDTATIARRTKTDAYLEELNLVAVRDSKPIRKQLLQIEYGHANDAMRNIYSLFATIPNKNLIALHHLTDEYKPQMVNGSMDSAPTGKRVLEGLTGTARYFDVCVRNEKAPVSNSITSKIVTCGYNLGLEGMPIVPDPDWNSLVGLIEGSLSNRIVLPKR